jgi:hypothetical protein
VTLTGEQALSYARSRHFEISKTPNRWQEDPSSDFGRIHRQQQFIKAALRKAVTKGVRNPFVLRDLLGFAQKNVTLDTSFSIGDIVSLGTSFSSFNPDSLLTFTPPATGTMVGAMSVLLLDTAATKPIFEIFRGTAPMVDPSEATSNSVAPSTALPSTSNPPTSAPTTTVPPTTSTTLGEFVPQPPAGGSCL